MFIRGFASILCAAALLCGCNTETGVVKTQIDSDAMLSESIPEYKENRAVMDSAAAAVVYCCDNGEILYGHNINDRKAIASITKIMTAVIALEYCETDDKAVKITEDMYAEGSSMYLRAGEILKLSDLVRGMMAVSGNDAANAAAVAVAGSKEKFAELMNKKAIELGMKNSYFVTPSGLDDSMHYSSAYDMALLSSYAMKNKMFREIVSESNITVNYVSPENKIQHLQNHNRLLKICKGCIGIKTGYTMKAGRTLTSCAERNGIRLAIVTLNDRNDWKDHCDLYDYAFGLVRRVKLADKNTTIEIPSADKNDGMICVSPEHDIIVTLKNEDEGKTEKEIYVPPFLFEPYEHGEKIGRIEFTLNGKIIASENLVITRERK